MCSSDIVDLALELELPIVPVRFAGGLPLEPISGKLEFPIGHCHQDYLIGSPIAPDELRQLPYAERGRRVLGAMNALGPPLAREEPNVADPAFSRRVAQWQAETGASEVEAVFFRILQEVENPGTEVTSLIEGARRGELALEMDPKSVWLAELARRLYGPEGPKVEIGT